MSGAARPGILFVIAAPSGTGKSTLARRLLESTPGLRFSISFTTRAPRSGERDGDAYHFVDEAAFRARAAAGGFLEWAEVHGRLYGTGAEATREALEAGADLLLDIDVQGARQVRERVGPGSVSVMILPPDRATLERRLAGRGTEDRDSLARRLTAAAGEAAQFGDFDYLVVNEDLDGALSELRAIVAAERCRTARRRERGRAILENLRGSG